MLAVLYVASKNGEHASRVPHSAHTRVTQDAQNIENRMEMMVEAAGVEPASENVTGQETTCLVRFLPQALPWDVRGRRSERTRNAFR